jgi:hypothetical protein
MPQRFLRPGINHSPRWNRVPPVAANFFIRLLTLVDDFGRCDGRPSVLWGYCFAVWNELHSKKITIPQTSEMLEQISKAELIDWYEVDGKKVVQIAQWQERIRENSRSKWPERTELAASCSKLQPSSSSPTSSPAPAYHAIGANGSKKPLRANTDVEDADWKQGLMNDVAYRHINIPAEFSKWQRWCARKKKKPTQGRFEVWLNNIDAPVTTFSGTRTVKPPKAVSEPEPEISEEQRLKNLERVGEILSALGGGMKT